MVAHVRIHFWPANSPAAAKDLDAIPRRWIVECADDTLAASGPEKQRLSRIDVPGRSRKFAQAYPHNEMLSNRRAAVLINNVLVSFALHPAKLEEPASRPNKRWAVFS